MKYLYFEHSNGEFVFIGEFPEEEIEDVIVNHVRKLNPNYTIYYTRIWTSLDGGTTYDVGSHTEFFHAYDHPIPTYNET